MKLNILEGLTEEQLKSPIARYLVKVDTVFPADFTVDQLLETLPGKKLSHEVCYFYVVDKTERLIGTIATRDVLFSPRMTKLKAITNKRLIKVDKTTRLSEALQLMAQHELMAIPVIDDNGSLAGMFEVTPEELKLFYSKNRSDSIKPTELKSNRQMFQMIGLSVDRVKLNCPFQEYRNRMPWLFCNIASGLFCAIIASLFRPLLDTLLVIAMFIPLVLALGESVSMQSMALSFQFLHYKKIPWKRVLSRFITESKTSILLGLSCALVVGSISYILFSEHWALLAISLSIIAAIFCSTAFGSLLPLVFHLFHLDPKLAAGPSVLMITDITVMMIYLSISNYLLLSS